MGERMGISQREQSKLDRMKKLVFLSLFFLLPAIPFAGEDARGMRVDNNPTVVVCMGSSSKRYHRTEYCRGLNNCQGGVKKITLEEAKRAGRTACKICYR